MTKVKMITGNKNNLEPNVWVPWRNYTDSQKLYRILEEEKYYLEDIKFFKTRLGNGSSEECQKIIWNIVEMDYESIKLYKYIRKHFNSYKHEEHYCPMVDKAKKDCDYNYEPFK